MGWARGAAALAAALVIGAGWAFVRSEDRRLASSQDAARAEPIDAVPRGALLLVTADLARLRAARVAPAILEAGRRVPGLGDVREACGFDPVATFDAIALAVPEGGDAGDFGVVARLGAGAGPSPVRPQQILACTSKVIAARGGSAVVSRLGRFETVRDVSLEAPGGEIAARPGGPLVLLGAGAYLRAMVDAAEGVVPSVDEHPGHARLRGALGPGAAVRASIVLGPAQRAAVAEEAAKAGADRAPPAIAKVGAAGVGVTFEGERTGVHLVLACDDGRAALEVAAALEALRGAQAASPLARLAGLGPVLDGLAIEVERDLVHASVVLARAEAEALVGRLLGGG